MLVDPSLLTVLDARVGDTLSLGDARFAIRGTVTNYPGDVGMRSALGPRVYISSEDVAGTGLLRFGSRARYDVYLRLPPGVDAQRLADRNRIRLSSERVSIRTVTEDQRSLNDIAGPARPLPVPDRRSWPCCWAGWAWPAPCARS